MAVLPPSAGVYIRETDLSQTVNPASVTTVAAVFGADQGPLEPTYISGGYNGQFTTLYGNPNPNTSYIHDCVQPPLNNGAAMWALRVVNGATYAGTTYYNTGTTTTFNATTNTDFPNTDVVSQGYATGGSRQLITLTFSAPITANDTVNVEIITSTGATVTASATYSVSSDFTLASLAASIESVIPVGATFGDSANVFVESVLGSTGSSDRIVVIQCPVGVQIAIGDITLLNSTSGIGAFIIGVSAIGGVSGGTLSTFINTDAQLFDVFAENPGTWGNGVGVEVTNIDTGTPNRVLLTFSQALITGNTFSGKLNGVTFGPISFTTDSNTTMANIAATIAALTGVASATVNTVSGSVSNNRTITVVSSVSAPNFLNFTNLVVTGGSTQPTVNTTTTITGVAPSGQFTLNVYLSSNINTPIESYTCTLGYATNGLGNQLNIAEQINAASNYIRIYQPSWSTSLSLYGTTVNGINTVDTVINFLGGGSNGALVTTAQLNAGLQMLTDRQLYPFNILMNVGYTDPYYQQDLVSFCETRQDCFAILDMPNSVQTSGQATAAYRQENINIDSSYGAVYSPWIQAVDPVTDALRFVPPSGAVAGVYVYNDKTINIAHAPAGMKVGVINTNALPVYYNYPNDTNLLAPAQVNPIIKRHNAFVIWDCYTLQTEYSALSFVPVRRMVSYIEITIADAIDYDTFEPNDSTTQFVITQLADSLLKPLLANQQIQGYAIVCNSTNNTPDTVDAGQLVVDIFITPTLPARQILLRGIITAQGANFQAYENIVGDSTTSSQ